MESYTISIKNIEESKKIYSKLAKWELARKTITNYFDENKLNISEEIVLIKVSIIDSLYKTSLKKQIDVAKHICSLKSLDADLKSGNIDAVNKVADWEKKILSFATKFCHFHNKEKYPLYDKYVCLALKNLIDYKDSRDFEDFFKTIKNFKMQNDLANVSLEDIDTFLWLYGQKLELDKGKKDINNEVKKIYDTERELFDDMEPK